MKLKNISEFLLSSIFLFMFTFSVNAQSKNIENGVEVTAGSTNIKIQFYSDNIVRIVKWCEGGTSEKLSLSVIQKTLPDLNLNVKESDETITLSSSKLSVKISKENGNIEYYTPDGKTILEEKEKPYFKPVEYFGDSGFTIKQNFKLTESEGIYGLGEQEDGYFNYRDKKVSLAQANVGAANSFLISTMNYGILWDNYSKTVFE